MRVEPAGIAPVPREAFAQPKRRYYSPARRKKAEATREALLDAAVAMIAEGDFRPEASAIAARAKVHPATINRHFSAIHLLYRVVARERSGAVLEALGLFPIDVPRLAALQADLVWIALTGRRRDGWA
jgi:AcrR family transcriptional regulator